MSGYVPKVGDKVTSANYPNDYVFTVLAIDGDQAWIRMNADGFRSTNDSTLLQPYVEPVVYPERWCNVYPNGISFDYPERGMADKEATPRRLGVIHLAADGTVTMEAP